LLCEAEEPRISAICKATTTKQGGKKSQNNNAFKGDEVLETVEELPEGRENAR
jgi:hypothetical protein